MRQLASAKLSISKNDFLSNFLSHQTQKKEILNGLRKMSDKVLLSSVKSLAQKERELLVQVLHHLLEIDRRKLFSDLGYPSLLEYCMKELSYSEGQACRRIKAMRLLKELPEIESKIEKGSLSLSNISQAQSFFQQQKQQHKTPVKKQDKMDLVEKLENQPAREGQKVLLQMQTGSVVLPKEKTRLITEEHTEVRFIMNKELEEKIEELKVLLGSKAIFMNFSDLLTVLADIGINELKQRKFGKKRVQAANTNTNFHQSQEMDANKIKKLGGNKQKLNSYSEKHKQLINRKKRTLKADAPPSNNQPVIKQATNTSKNPRYIPKSIKHEVWQRDNSKCSKCKSTHNLNFDHIKPVAVGGRSTIDNLRLLCFNCNQREAIKSFGERQFAFYDLNSENSHRKSGKSSKINQLNNFNS